MMFDLPANPDEVELLIQRMRLYQQSWYQVQAEWIKTVRNVIEILHDCFMAMEQGTANYRYPSSDCKITQERADKLIDKIDDFFDEELIRHPAFFAKRMGMIPDDLMADDIGEIVLAPQPPDFSQLVPHARLALAEQLAEVFKSEVIDVAQDIPV